MTIKGITTLFTALLLLILISNLTPVKLLLEPSIGKSYHFQSKDGSFQFDVIPSKGRSIEQMQRSIKKLEKEQKRTIKVYRTFKKNYFQFWNWLDYISNPIWNYPYL